MLLIDHLLAFTLIVIMPVSGYISYQRLIGRADAGESIDRIKLYMQTIATQWSVFIAAMAIWFYQASSAGLRSCCRKMAMNYGASMVWR